jgi:hypothetical protein
VDDGQAVNALGACPEGTDDPDLVEIREVRFDGHQASVTFSLPAGAEVSLTVFDIAGRRVSALSEGWYPAGTQTVVWDLGGLARGVYFVRLFAAGAVQTHSILLR